MNIISWPPDYTIKKHPRAKHIKLKASIKHGLEVIVPSRYNHHDIPPLLEHHRQWIEKQLLKLASHQQFRAQDQLPEKIELRMLNQVWDIQYVASQAKLRLVQRPHQALVVLGNIANKSLCNKLLSTWVKKQAKTHLPLQLIKMSQQTNLGFDKVTVRNQQTRWGSCSKEKAINLNYKLIFFPLMMANHILIHELCHTVHMNHSEKFWQLVAHYDPQWREHRRQTRHADQLIPMWVM